MFPPVQSRSRRRYTPEFRRHHTDVRARHPMCVPDSRCACQKPAPVLCGNQTTIIPIKPRCTTVYRCCTHVSTPSKTEKKKKKGGDVSPHRLQCSDATKRCECQTRSMGSVCGETAAPEDPLKPPFLVASGQWGQECLLFRDWTGLTHVYSVNIPFPYVSSTSPGGARRTISRRLTVSRNPRRVFGTAVGLGRRFETWVALI